MYSIKVLKFWQCYKNFFFESNMAMPLESYEKSCCDVPHFFVFSFSWLCLLKFYLCFIQRRNDFNQGRRRLNGRAYRAQQEDSIRRTVYVSDIDQHVSF
jgi:hypothetical protein